MALAPAYHLILFHTKPKRPIPSRLKFCKENDVLVPKVLLVLPLLCLYPTARDKEPANNQLRAKAQL